MGTRTRRSTKSRDAFDDLDYDRVDIQCEEDGGWWGYVRVAFRGHLLELHETPRSYKTYTAAERAAERFADDRKAMRKAFLEHAPEQLKEIKR